MSEALELIIQSQKVKRETINVNDNVVFIRQVSLIDAGVGCGVWEGATMLAKLFLSNKDLFKNQFKKSLELGSGTGICGIYYSMVNNVICTDYKESLLENILYNKTVNIEIDGKEDFLKNVQLNNFKENAINIKNNMDIAFLDWFNPLKEEPDMELQTRSYLPDNIYDISPYVTKIQNQQFDFIFGSEISYCEQTAQALANVINMYLINNGIFVMIVSKYRGHGVNSFLDDLRQLQFNTKCFEVPQQFYEYRNKNMEQRGEEYVFVIAYRNNNESESKYNQVKQIFNNMQEIDLEKFQFRSTK